MACCSWHERANAQERIATVLYAAVYEVRDILETLPEYVNAVITLKTCFQPKVNNTYKKLRNAAQNSGESLDSFWMQLSCLAQTCEFANEDKEIKSQ